MRVTRLVESACRQTYTRFFRHSAGVMDETAPVFTTNDSLPGTFLHEKALRKQRRRVEPCSLRPRIDHRLSDSSAGDWKRSTPGASGRRSIKTHSTVQKVFKLMHSSLRIR
jgi:hypothetical protein